MRKQDWIPVSQLPAEMIHRGEPTGVSHHMLVTDGQVIWIAYYMFSDENKWAMAYGKSWDEFKERKVTHWMPLPEKP